MRATRSRCSDADLSGGPPRAAPQSKNEGPAGPSFHFRHRLPGAVQNEWWIPVSTTTWFAVLDTPAVKNAAFAPPEPCSYSTFA